MDDDNNLLGRIYDAALDRDLWPEVLDGLCRKVDCRVGGLLHAQVNPVCVTIVGTTGLDPSLMGSIPEIFGNPDDNPFLRKLPELTPGMPISRQELIDDETFERSRVYTDFFKPQDVYHDVTTPLTPWRNETAGLFLSRPRSAGPMDESDLRILRPCIPHLQRALQINRELGVHRAGTSLLNELLDQISSGVALIRSDGRIVTMNEAAERIVLAADGLAIGDGRLAAASRWDNADLNKAIAIAAAGKGGHGLLIRRPSGRRAYSVFTVPLPRAVAVNGFPTPMTAVLIGDTESAMEPHVRAAARLYGLSPAETAVALEVVKGLGRTAVAAKLGISRHTVKTHLGRIFEKTGTVGQVELARLLGSSSILRNGAGE